MLTPRIRQLPAHLANQIAAGEVVERPASVVKELVENSLDAGATSIRISTTGAGLERMIITDNGHGIEHDQLPLALARHATSKITTTDDLFRIGTFGFRGEALPSIASVARLTLASRTASAQHGWEITPEGELRPSNTPLGTQITVADLFYTTPARRKFIKSARAEKQAVDDVLRRLALANPHAAFAWDDDASPMWSVQAEQADWLTQPTQRLATLLGPDFLRALSVYAERGAEGVKVHGFISPPTLHTATARQLYTFINGRPVLNKTLQTAVRQAYGDALVRGRFPLAVLHFTLPLDAVDVNVHPAKTEVRFRTGTDLFGFVMAACTRALAENSAGRTSPSPSAFKPYTPPAPQANLRLQAPLHLPAAHAQPLDVQPQDNTPDDAPNFPLGHALGQVHATYIVAQTEHGLMLVDQHAAHERLVYEKLKAQLAHGLIQAQPMLIPSIVTLSPLQVEALMAHAKGLEKYGLELEHFSPTAVAVQALPSLLGAINPAPLLTDLAEELTSESGFITTLDDKLHAILSTFACHHSIRAGRVLSIAEQNALLRQIEANPACATCNHGRPTAIPLTLVQLESMFGR